MRRHCSRYIFMAISIAFRRADGLSVKCQRMFELVWLTGQLAPDFKTIADFRNRRKAIREGLPYLRGAVPRA